MRILEKLIRAGWQRKTRFRDEKNNPILISDLRFIFPAVYEYIKLKNKISHRAKVFKKYISYLGK